MPAAAVAIRTPSIGGMSGKFVGASGEMFVMLKFIRGASCPATQPSLRRLRHDDQTEVGNLDRSVLLRLVGLVEAFDLGALAQLGDELGLRLAHQEGLD